MSGIQSPIGIDTVNPVDANYKIGPWASVAAAKAGIPLALRYGNMYFYVIGDPLIYYWLDSDLTDGGLKNRVATGLKFIKNDIGSSGTEEIIVQGSTTGGEVSSITTIANSVGTLPEFCYLAHTQSDLSNSFYIQSDFILYKVDIGANGLTAMRIDIVTNDVTFPTIVKCLNNVNIGGVTSGGLLTLKQTTALSNTAPIKFITAGAVLNTTPEIGAFEVDSSGNPYFSIATNDRRNFKFIQPKFSRVVTVSTLTPTFGFECHDITNLNGNLTVANPSYTGRNFEQKIIRIKDNGTARTISWGTAYINMGVALPLTTIANKWQQITFVYNDTLNQWGCVAISNQP